MKKGVVWCIRFLIVSIFIPGIIAAISGKVLDGLMRFLAWPITRYVHIMPGLQSMDVEKWLYAASALFIEFLVLAGIVLLIAEWIGKPRLSNPSMRFIAHLLAQVEVSIRNVWGLAPHECRFYWLVSKQNEYDYFTSDKHLNDDDKLVTRRAFELKEDFKAERNLHKDFANHPAHQYVFIRNSGKFQAGMIVFINEPNVLNKAAMVNFMAIVEPIISLDGTREIMLELTKKRGVIVV